MTVWINAYLLFVILTSNAAVNQKTCTCIVLNPQENDSGFKFCSFGNEANEKWHYLAENKLNSCGFKYFKLNLFHENETIPAKNGLRVLVEDLIMWSLKVYIIETWE